MNKKMTRIIGIVAVLALVAVAFVGAGAALPDQVRIYVQIDSSLADSAEWVDEYYNPIDDEFSGYNNESISWNVEEKKLNLNGGTSAFAILAAKGQQSKYTGDVKIYYKKEGGTEYYEMTDVVDISGLTGDQIYYVLAKADGRKITVESPITGGSITADRSVAKSGDTVTLTVTPNAGYKMKTLKAYYMEGPIEIEIDLNKVSETKYTFDMPDADVTVTGSFEDDTIVTYTIGEMSNGHISTVSGGTETTESIANVKKDTAFVIDGDKITMKVGDSDENRYAVADEGYVLDTWYIGGTEIVSGTTKPVAGALKATFKKKADADDTLLVNDSDTEHTTNLYKDDDGNYFAYKGDVTVPLYLNGSTNHTKLNGYDVQVKAVDPKGTIITLTKDSVNNLLTAWTNGDKTVKDNIVSMSFSNVANDGTVDISPSAASKTSLFSVKITGVEKTGTDETYKIYVMPDTVASATGNKMFSAFNKDLAELSIADIDNGLFDAANTDNLVLTFYVKDLAELSKYTVSDYAGDYTKQDTRVPVDLLWEREVGKDAGIVATFNSAVGTNPTVSSWNIVDAATGTKLSDYLNNITGTFGTGKDTVSGSFTTKEHDAPTDKVSGSLTLTVKNDESKEITDTHPVTIQKWLNSSANNYSTVTIGNDLTVTLKVMGNQVKTSEEGTGTTGWNTYATFPAFGDKMTSGTWTPVSTTYKVGDVTVNYVITNGGSEGKMTVGGNMFITTNEVNDSSKTITVTMTGKKFGDATMNGAINIGDSSAMGVDILRSDTSKLLQGENKLYADVDKDGSITATDVQNLNKYLVGSTS